MNLSVCVIGRNESKNLPQMIQSLKLLSDLRLKYETIYIDSASSDNSVELAKGFFTRTIVLKGSKNLCASAGRHVGTLVANGDWILYLDGDMKLHQDFHDVLAKVCSKHALNVGWVGRCDYIFDDGSKLLNVGTKREHNATVDNFGGAVLLPKKIVLDSGNWTAGLFSNEEFELYTRLIENNCEVRFTNSIMMEHYTHKISSYRSMIACFSPGAALGKKFYGYGQLLAFRIQSKNIFKYIKYRPQPFIWSAFLLFSLASLVLGGLAISIILLSLGLVISIIRGGLKAPVFHTALMVQAVFGFFKYDAKYYPIIEKEYQKKL